MFDACSSAANISASSLLTIQGKLLKVITTTCVKQFTFIVCSRSSYLLSRHLKHTVVVGRGQRRLQEGGSGDGVLGSVPGRESDCTQVFQFN